MDFLYTLTVEYPLEKKLPLPFAFTRWNIIAAAVTEN